MRKIAFYGKGGIGKSTIAANVSAACAGQGKRVLHIGCDPKADSARVLVSGKIPTVLEQIEQKGRVCEEDILFPGKNGVVCVEAGGPHAGTGCAGLGITAAMKELERLGILRRQCDLVVYDVLGDVVCGGFSVPMRKTYADKVYIVTSADFMSLYAANNIIKGCIHYSDKDRQLLGGLILNHVKGRAEQEIGRKFSEATKVPLVAVLEESPEMRTADYQNKLFTELFPEGRNAGEIRQLLKGLTESSESGNAKELCHGMTGEELDRFRMEVFRSELIL